uniref:serine/threonine-protein kinase/endoribonuclease IRE1-like n=1 Tax=Oncorhynchus gorbuscha TaxID=8017 RepID=UPI001EAF548E|nr:serine/threonine-protein kinase/endoribonuclease IRE1-like [Oncorhynchus gorbuscha]XP_046161954.1 serine/threonine-protein kinase/endoribonuclease IRE1-like [Oncorhynchus gorbuscha]
MTSKEDAAEFVDRHMAELIQRVRKVMPIADDLLRRGMIQYEMFANISTSKTNPGKMREVYKALQSGGTPLKAAFYRILLKNERLLVIDLAAEFVDRHRAELIQRVHKVMPIADDLLRRGMINPEVYSNIQTANTSQDQMRELYKAVQSGGPEVKSAFYRILLKEEPHLVINLGPALPPASNIFPGTGVKPAALASDEESVGKITYNTNNHLGKGADGIVFRGYFHCDDVNKRPAAVKRIELAKQSNADREVALLLQLDDNPHVVRYFCTEKDRQFLYIAIELCAVSLDKCFTKENPFDLRGLNPVMLLQQTMIGLEHLHCHNIVHRDVKPHNILLKDHSDSVTVKISDFGMSKQLVDGRQSYSMRSGALGTMGWNAPEVLDDSRRVNPTSAVDIFSAGCVFYYVLTGGEHPFGKPNRRAGNIEDGKYNLDGLKKDKHEDIVTTDLIEQMLNMEPQRRPSAESVLKHPFFWSLEKQLMFFQDVSDSIVNETSDGPIIQQLESGGQEVVRNNWMEQITAVLQKDLEIRKGAYEEDSVKSLLRAIRNKKHHYHDSPKEVQKTLGSIPDDFVPYFTSRFPHLLLHTFLAMRSFAEELTLQHYYLKSNTKLRRQKRTHPA